MRNNVRILFVYNYIHDCTSYQDITVISRKNLTHFLFNEFFNEKRDYESNIIKYEFFYIYTIFPFKLNLLLIFQFKIT